MPRPAEILLWNAEIPITSDVYAASSITGLRPAQLRHRAQRGLAPLPFMLGGEPHYTRLSLIEFLCSGGVE